MVHGSSIQSEARVKVRILGCSGGIGGRHLRTTSLLVDNDILIDAGTGVSYEVGSDNMLPGMDDALLGMSAGETKTFTAPLAGGEHEGADADCTVTVSSVKVRELPELDDAFAQMASEFDTLADLRADLTKGVEQAKRFEQGVAARDKILDVEIDCNDPGPLGQQSVARGTANSASGTRD